MRVVEKFYSVAETSLLLSISRDTVMRWLKAGELGADVVNLGSDAAPDYRIPAGGINAWLDSRRVFLEPGITARSIGGASAEGRCKRTVSMRASLYDDLANAEP